MTLEIRIDTESLSVTVLIKVGVVAAFHLIRVHRIDAKPCLVPEPRILACLIIFVADVEVEVASFALPDCFVFLKRERRGVIQISVEANEIAHRRECIVQYYIHPTTVDLLYDIPPFFDGAVVVVEYGEIERREGIRGPWLIDKSGAGDVQAFDTQTLEVVKGVSETSDVSAMSELIAEKVLLKGSTVRIVVGRITIGEPTPLPVSTTYFVFCETVMLPIEEERVERKSPVLWRRIKCMVLPVAPIVQGMRGRFVLIKIIL